jgi:two-component system, OmpR family, alkaline phosphatase synthesis response regulator PhoP
MAERILIVEDEQGLVMSLRDRLENEGYEVVAKTDGVRGELAAMQGGFVCIILDVMLPERDGFQVCRNLRQKGVGTPILMLTARSTAIDTVMGLKLGADDYCTKPFDMQVLLARVEALIRRSGTAEEEGAGGVADELGRFTFGEFTLDTEKQILSRSQEVVPLNAQEYRLLRYMVTHADRVLSRQKLLDEVWGYDAVTTTRTVDVHVARLRQKIDDQETPRYLLTIRGLGYKFVMVRNGIGS